jgi:hypothetical protein
MIDAGEQRHRRHQSRAERGSWLLIVNCTRCAPAGTPYRVFAILRRVRLHRLQLGHLVTHRVGVRHFGQRLRAALAVRREQRDELVDLLGRQQLALGGPMPGLRAPLALGLRLALAPTLPACRRWIARRWPVGVSRILPQPLEYLRELLAQLGDALLELRAPRVLGDDCGLQLRDSLVPPVLRHGCVASPSGAQMESENFLWSNLAHLRGA